MKYSEMETYTVYFSFLKQHSKNWKHHFIKEKPQNSNSTVPTY